MTKGRGLPFYEDNGDRMLARLDGKTCGFVAH